MHWIENFLLQASAIKERKRGKKKEEHSIKEPYTISTDTATHNNTLSHTARHHCNTLQHSATHRCSTATYCNTCVHSRHTHTCIKSRPFQLSLYNTRATLSMHRQFNTLQHVVEHVATHHCNTLRRTATHYCNTLRRTATHVFSKNTPASYRGLSFWHESIAADNC